MVDRRGHSGARVKPVDLDSDVRDVGRGLTRPLEFEQSVATGDSELDDRDAIAAEDSRIPSRHQASPEILGAGPDAVLSAPLKSVLDVYLRRGSEAERLDVPPPGSANPKHPVADGYLLTSVTHG
jgi:hypothetical protein